ncbi:AraC family transcriptional regulator [Bradyrhizobium sp. CCBAU 51753]|uniref:helix-turn-helix domain-containing protein n=1 Tax=Bradyrhizobium sp. CCBAU 51753 TaxID=1325100 RepID=UPI001FEFD380|nr:AraC family transcriptional regulator [Bradyrhizobium sp. CCBAU 51753]
MNQLTPHDHRSLRLSGERRSFLDSCAHCEGGGARIANADTRQQSQAFIPLSCQGGRSPMSTNAADLVSHRFSTRELPGPMRLPLWRESFVRGIVHADIEPLSSAPFQAEARLQAIQGLRTLALKGSAMRFKRLRPNITDGDDSIGFIVCSRSRSQLAQRGQDVELRGGDAIAILHSEPAIVTYVDGLLLGLAVPRDALAQRVTDVEGLAMRPISRRTEAFRLLMAYLRSVFKQRALAAPNLRGTVVAHIHDLVALSIGEYAPLGESGASAVVAARHSAVLAYIAAHFQDPGLSVQAAARGQGISPRYLQRLMASSGSSFTGHVNELRLQQAFKLLSEFKSGPQRISDIALEVGFSDVSHFNRLFRARFGDSPSGVRAAGRNSI